MKKALKLIVVALNVVVLSSCATSGYKVAPESKTANLRLVAVPSNNNFVFANNGNDCISPEFKPGGEIAVLGAKANLMADRQAGRKIGMPLYEVSVPQKQQTELKIEANKSIAFSFAGVGISSIMPTSIGNSYCMKKIEFTPAENINYEAVYDMISTEKGKDCSAKLYEIKEVAGRFIKEESKNYKLIENFCKK